MKRGTPLATLRDQISAVTVSSARWTPRRPRAAPPGQARAYPSLMPGCSWQTTDLAKWRVHVIREIRDADGAELERVAYRRARRRFPGDGSIWRYRMASGQARYAISVTTRDGDGAASSTTRRTDRARQPMTTRAQAEDALADALANGIWNRPPPVPGPASGQGGGPHSACRPTPWRGWSALPASPSATGRPAGASRPGSTPGATPPSLAGTRTAPEPARAPTTGAGYVRPSWHARPAWRRVSDPV